MRAREQLKRQGCQKIIFSTWRPKFYRELDSVPFDLRCYHIDDEYSFSPIEMPVSPEEMQALKAADQVFVTSKALFEKKGWINENTTLVPNGVDYAAFATATSEPEDLALVPRPRIGYAGFLKDQLDWDLLLELSARHPTWHFVFLGPISPHLETIGKVAELRKRSNVHFLNARPSNLVPGYVQHFDVCTMPYRQNDYTKYIYPLKLHEYLASGRPTVGTPIRSLEEFSGMVTLARSAEEWSVALADALSPAANKAELCAARQAVAKRHDWELHVRTIAMTLLDRVAPELLPTLHRSSVTSRFAAANGDTGNDRLDWSSIRLAPSTAPANFLESTEVVPSEGSSPQSLPKIGPVLLVSPWYKPAIGGVAEVAERLYRTFTRAGVETHLMIARADRGGLRSDPAIPNIWHWSVASSAFDRLTLKSLLGTLVRGPLCYWRLDRFVRTHRIRTILLIYPIGYAWPFMLLRRITDVRIIASLHGNDVTKFSTYQPSLRWLIRQVLERADLIITCAKHLGTKAQEICSNRALSVHLIPNCVDSTHFTPPPPNFVRSSARPTFVHVSNFAPKKCITDIIEAFAEPCVPSEARLIMVGDGHDHAAATDRARSLGVSNRIEFVGSQKDIRPFLWQSDVFVLASDDEGSPLVLLEAMACGLPWVSTLWGPAALLPAGECGLVVPPKSPKLLAHAMAELIANPERRLSMGRQARQRAVVDFREQTYSEKHLQVIRWLERKAAEDVRRKHKSQELPDTSTILH
jgi:glycosyltransferase involved in cell wall biosynthesis